MSLIVEFQVPGGLFQIYSQKPDITFTKVKQIHSDIVVESKSELSHLEADGIISFNELNKNEHFNLCIVTADCLPLYICGEKGYAMLHAGWKGLQKKIIQSPKIKKLKPYYAFIGPHIGQNNYQVGAEFCNYFPHSNCLIEDQTESDKFKLSLEIEAHYQLKQLNPEIIIKKANICTFDHEKFHSYRKDSTMSRNWNIFVYRE
jgi:polyphenol oxidase